MKGEWPEQCLNLLAPVLSLNTEGVPR